jgi:hypothetical protein
MMRDRTGEDDLPLTQENLATMPDSGRPRINALLAGLEKDGLVRRFRGRIRLLTRSGLRDVPASATRNCRFGNRQRG